MDKKQMKPLEWIASSKADLKKFPIQVQQDMGYALYHAQVGTKHVSAKPLKGLGSGVLEVVSDHATDTYRSVYTVRFTNAVYVLHTFQKKAKHGIATPKHETELIRKRLKDAKDHYTKHYEK